MHLASPCSIGSILVCHFLISLQEAKQHHYRDSQTTPSFVAPDFAGTSSQLPPFIAPLGELVHSGFEASGNACGEPDLDCGWETASEFERRGSDSTAVASEPGKKGSVVSMEDPVSEIPV